MKKLKSCMFISILVLLGTLGMALATHATESEGHPSSWLAPSVDQIRVFQQNLDGYAGARDTWISRADWGDPPQHTVNYGQNEILQLGRSGGENPLLYFDLTNVPTNSAVLSATLSLYNTTSGSCSSPGTLPRRVLLYSVLRDWNEGNQESSPIDTSGDHGTTGDYASQYYPGEGTDVPWNVRGMAEGSDYVATSESLADVVNQGWYTWEVTSLVRAWIRGESPNYGLVLRDATGYEVDNCDYRSFVSSQATADTSQRPKLTVVYNPDVPYADAGDDQESLTWDGGAVTLDGSASHDRPGGDDATLTFAWRVVQPAYGSTISGTLLMTDSIASFTPDVAGEWEIELTVTNDVSESATDRVSLRLLSIPATHPRIFLTTGKLAALQARAVSTNTRWSQLLAYADAYSSQYSMHVDALVGAVTGQTSYCDEAVATALDIIADPGGGSTEPGDLALVYDWCYAQLDAGQRTTFIDHFNTWADDQLANPGYIDVPGWGNYWPRYGYSFALVGLATYGDNPRAQEWLDEFRHTRYRNVDLPLLEKIADGGGWPEGMIYDWIANLPRIKALEAWRTGAGENLFESTAWYRERLGYILLHRWPGLTDQYGYEFHPYPSIGDTERNRGSIGNYERIMGLVLVERFSDEPLARQLQAYLSAPPTDGSMSFLYSDEFLWFNPNQPSQTPDQHTHYDAGTGTLLMRSGWPDGAADTDTSATYVTFQSGDHFSYHQHYDQNSFTLFKYDDLALDSGVYSGDGRSYHDRNFYVRTIAHNTLIVYNPDEDFSSARPDAESNDGGQRTMYPGSRAPETVEYFDQHAVHYENGDILRFQDDARYTYALGDATQAYNNPTYNQTMDTSLSGNVAKVSRFQREFVYLRPVAQGRRDYVVTFDRVGVVSPTFSGENTKLLFHTLDTPTVNGTPQVISPGETLYADADLATAISGNGKLFIKTLLPENHNLRVVGGRGQKAFWAFGENYDWHWDAGELQPRPTTEFDPIPYGEWRIELEPANTALEHNFLTVLHPTISTTVAMPEAVVVSGTGLSGVHIADPDMNRVAIFSAANDGSASTGVLSYTYTPTTHTHHLIFDLTPGTNYQLEIDLDSNVQTVTLTPDGGSGDAYEVSSQGVLSFTTRGGPTPLAVMLRGTPSDGTIYLTWQVSGELPPTVTWQLDYESETGTALLPPVGLTNTVRSYTFTGLTNYVWYTVTLRGMGGSAAILTDTARVMPTDRFVYLPFVLK
ncbi:MAG: DNRLRE domain-containing protein [Chloroflexi bacterium]|nr:DNRLRE domain-containing protein [Chloroflexota bacterium]